MASKLATLLLLLAVVLLESASRGFDHIGCPDAFDPPIGSTPPRFSLLALGDAGRPDRWPALFDGQLAVAQGLLHEDARMPVELLVFLGDNFYEEGLEAAHLEERLRSDLVAPYCHFLDRGAVLWRRVAGACDASEGSPHPIPIVAVLGNHDYGAQESPRLQQEVVPTYVANWHVAPGAVSTRRVAPGVSLVLVDSHAFAARSRGAEPESLTTALRSVGDRWSILVAHHPILPERSSELGALVGAIRASERPVQLVLSGHRHNLQARPSDDPPGLHVVAGSGGMSRRVREDGQLLAAARLGFVRVDVALDSLGVERLFVSFFAVPDPPHLPRCAPVLLGRWSVDDRGGVRSEPVAAAPEH